MLRGGEAGWGGQGLAGVSDGRMQGREAGEVVGGAGCCSQRHVQCTALQELNSNNSRLTSPPDCGTRHALAGGCAGGDGGKRACRNQRALQPMQAGTNCCLCNSPLSPIVLPGVTLKHRAVAHSHPPTSGLSTWCRRQYHQLRKSCTGRHPSGGRSGTAGRQAGKWYQMDGQAGCSRRFGNSMHSLGLNSTAAAPRAARIKIQDACCELGRCLLASLVAVM